MIRHPRLHSRPRRATGGGLTITRAFLFWLAVAAAAGEGLAAVLYWLLTHR